MLSALLPAFALGPIAILAASTYSSDIAAWRKAREEQLRSDGNWLTVTGFFWLDDGPNTFGRGPGNKVVLPDGPARAGVFTVRNRKVTVTADGKTRAIKPNSDDAFKAGRLTLLVLERGGRFAIRLKDPQSQARREFRGIDYYPPKAAYRVTAKFIPRPRKVPVLNVLGQTEQYDSPGYAEFRLSGQTLKLYAILEEPGAKELFYIFRDQTSGKETYGAGRFLYSDLPRDGKVTLDFNKAYNPPCAFTAYATCPLPPPGNRLPVRIEAGEKKYGDH
jgi:uncharacterized protein